MASQSTDLQDLPTHKLRSILEQLGGSAVIYTSKENRVAKTQQGSMRSKIVEKVAELQGIHGGAILTPKGGMVEGPAKEAFIEWYLEQRAEDVAKNPEKDYKKWAMIHLADSLKHRKESVKELEPATA